MKNFLDYDYSFEGETKKNITNRLLISNDVLYFDASCYYDSDVIFIEGGLTIDIDDLKHFYGYYHIPEDIYEKYYENINSYEDEAIFWEVYKKIISAVKRAVTNIVGPITQFIEE